MTTAPFTMRPYQPADEVGVLALLQESLGQGRTFERSDAFWRWKHFDNPFGSSFIIVAENEEILGLRAFLRWQFRAGGATLSAVRAVDTATHPGYRRMGVFSALTKSALDQVRSEGVHFIFNTPNQFSLPGYLKLGWTYVGRPRVLVKILRPIRMAMRLSGFAKRDSEEFAIPREPARAATALFGDVGALEHLVSANERLIEPRISTARSVDYLRWRYTAVPAARPYYACWTGSQPSNAAAIFRLGRRGPYTEVMLSELLLARSGEDEVRRLVRGLGHAVEADYIIAHAPGNSPHWRTLRASGFIPVPRVGPHLVIRSLTDQPSAPSLTSMQSWGLTLGDLELF